MLLPLRPPPRHWSRRRLLHTAAAAGGLLAACRRGEPPPPVDRPTLESEASAAVLRHLAQEAVSAAPRAELAIIVLGPAMEDASGQFRQRLSDLPLPLVSSERMTTYWVGPVARVMDRESQKQPLQLQIFSVEARPDGSREVVAAWAFEDRMRKKRFLVRPAAGSWDIQPLETLAEKP